MASTGVKVVGNDTLRIGDVSITFHRTLRIPEASTGVKVVVNDTLQIGDVSVTFHRTLRIPEGSKTYPCTPELGSFPIRSVSDFGDKVPASWREHGGVFVGPVLQREAVWLKFGGREWRPKAIKVAAGKLCAVTGKPWSEALHQEPQNYLVAPSCQPWLDGINSGEDTIVSQFVAKPLGTKEDDTSDDEKPGTGSFQLFVFDPKPGVFPDLPPPRCSCAAGCCGSAASSPCRNAAPWPCFYETPAAPPRARGADLWNQSQFSKVFVHLCNSDLWTEITGQALPESPVSEETYSKHGLPWSELFEEKVPPPRRRRRLLPG